MAGCAGDGQVVDYENLDNNELAEGKGAIAGVLFDDRYRPIHLVPEGEAVSEFQADGFILVQETGPQVLTNENGDFAVLDPGKLRKVIAQNSITHGKHDQAAEITYLWEFRDEKAADGEYEIEMSIPNFHNTAVAKGKAGFTVEGAKAYGIADNGEEVPATAVEGGQDAPGAPVFVGILAIGLLAVLRRRN